MFSVKNINVKKVSRYVDCNSKYIRKCCLYNNNVPYPFCRNQRYCVMPDQDYNVINYLCRQYHYMGTGTHKKAAQNQSSQSAALCLDGMYDSVMAANKTEHLQGPWLGPQTLQSNVMQTIQFMLVHIALKKLPAGTHLSNK